MASNLSRALESVKPKWYLPQDDLASNVLNPALTASDRFDCMSGYFNSAVLRELAHGLAQFLINSDAPFRLLVSSEISAEDQNTILQGQNLSELATSIVESAFQDPESLKSALIKHTKSCLAYLVKENRLQIKVVLMKNGIFHPKVWFFYSEQDYAVLSGSANATGSGIGRNVEQITLQKSWNGSDDLAACKSDQDFFLRYWQGEMDDSITLDLPYAIAQNIVGAYPASAPPDENAYMRALRLDKSFSGVTNEKSKKLNIPVDLQWESGEYRHQGDAVKAWELNNRQGILAMATGAGKTITSLVAATRLSRELHGLLVVIAVPSRVLLNQWAEDVRSFGVDPYVASIGGSSHHLKILDEKIHSLELGMTSIEVVIITLNLLKNERTSILLTRHSDKVLLIADEMHNLGVEKFTSSPPLVKYRLGLSATPERQYDASGSAALFDYFGNVVFEFSLDQAIGICLVPYNYLVCKVILDPEEQENFSKLTEKIRKSFARVDPSDTQGMRRIQRLREERRLVLESANEKVPALREWLSKIDINTLHHTLIYCTDKDPNQLNQVNALLTDLGVRYHQITDVESSNRKLITSSLNQFRKGNLQVLTAKRILDEGFNIPEIERALILASTTVERQWTQRRGRVLRLCPEIGKESAEIIDFVTVPAVSSSNDPDMQKVVEMELTRVEEFTRLAKNRAAKGGPLDFIQELRSIFLTGG